MVVCVPKIIATLRGSDSSSRARRPTPVSTIPFTAIGACAKGSSTDSVLQAT